VTSQVIICPYDEEEPAIWFRLIEAQFAAAGIKSDQPFDLLKEVFLGQFRKSKWQSYFELLQLPMEMLGLKSSVLMGKLKQYLPHGVSPDNDLFLAMFFIHLSPSMQEAVSAGNHKTALAMVRAADALWDASGGHNPTVGRSRSPAPANWKRNGNTRSKSRPPSGLYFFSFQNPGNGMCKFHNFYGNKAHKCIFPCSYSEN
jgi:hypothetical protein